MPKFSIVIPTRARADTLVHALKTASDQEYADLEILVHESGDDAETARVVEASTDQRVRHVKTGHPVTMTENWERALNCATGEYITFIGDDDGILPDACAIAERILRLTSADLLSWRPACYFWPQYVGAQQRNRLVLHLRRPDVIEQRSSQVALDLFYRFRTDYSRLPMIYNSFVSRALVERIQAKVGCYFLGSAPDVTSGIVNALFSEHFLVSCRPLSSSGLSHNSTGHRMFFSRSDSLRQNAIDQAFPGEAPPAKNLTLFIGDEMLAVKNRLFPNDAPSFHARNLLWSGLQSLQDVDGDYPSMLQEMQQAAARSGLSIENWIEPRQSIANRPANQGVRAESNDVLMDIDCSRAGIANIHQAIRLLSALLPSLEHPKFISVPEPMRSVAQDRNTILKFGREGNGLLFLSYGWSDPEDWGVWSIGRDSEILIVFSEPPSKNLKLRIEGRMLLHASRPRARGAILCNGRKVTNFEASFERPHVSLELPVRPEESAGRELSIRFEIDQSRSPAEDGISSDTRRLGFGLEEIAIPCGRS